MINNVHKAYSLCLTVFDLGDCDYFHEPNHQPPKHPHTTAQNGRPPPRSVSFRVSARSCCATPNKRAGGVSKGLIRRYHGHIVPVKAYDFLTWNLQPLDGFRLNFRDVLFWVGFGIGSCPQTGCHDVSQTGRR